MRVNPGSVQEYTAVLPTLVLSTLTVRLPTLPGGTNKEGQAVKKHNQYLFSTFIKMR